MGLYVACHERCYSCDFAGWWGGGMYVQEHICHNPN